MADFTPEELGLPPKTDGRKKIQEQAPPETVCEMPLQQRRDETFRMYFIEHMTEQEIADFFGKSVGTISRDIKKMREERVIPGRKHISPAMQEYISNFSDIAFHRFFTVIRELWKQYRKAEDGKAVKVKILQQIFDTESKFIDRLQSLGLMYKEPEHFKMDDTVAKRAQIMEIADKLKLSNPDMYLQYMRIAAELEMADKSGLQGVNFDKMEFEFSSDGEGVEEIEEDKPEDEAGEQDGSDV
ncbi:MAG: hypothetical protein PHS46_08005 [Candidatus Omnitrophica bacterium]|nr:hypothetical protein [Candidatus Omnitrophota bacterium]